MSTCTACNGSGHDKASRPVVKFKVMERQVFDKTGAVKIEEYKQHTTVAQGSGCMNCLGRGVK